MLHLHLATNHVLIYSFNLFKGVSDFMFYGSWFNFFDKIGWTKMSNQRAIVKTDIYETMNYCIFFNVSLKPL